MDYRELYAEIGKLLYAVADADGIISKEEKDNLHNLIQTRLLHKETHTDEFGTNDAWYAEFEFDVAEDQDLTAEEAFKSFLEYIEANRKFFTEDIRLLCLTLADRIADSYKHTNQQEKKLIQNLREALFSLDLPRPEPVKVQDLPVNGQQGRNRAI
jgi:uncharacterized tellurite resistance protein B-like protein